MPYLCSVDFIMSERMGLGLARTMTLAEGNPHCNFRFKHSGPTIWPVGMQEEVERSLSDETVSLLRHPVTHEPLRYESERFSDGRFREWLVAAESGDKFPIEDGIPIFIQPGDIVGLNKKYRTFYQLSAPLYDFFVRLFGYFWGGSETVWRQEFLRDLEIEPGDHVLEVSVGTGGNLRLLPETAEYFGLDLTKGMLHQCRRNLRRWQRSATLFNGNAERLPFDDASFDVVLHVGGINFFNDQEAAIQEMIRVVKPGGHLAFTEATWRIPPPPDMAQQMAHALGLPEGVLKHEAWRTLLENSKLEQLVAEEYPITFREETRNQYSRIDISDYLRTFGRFLKVLVNPAYRAIYREALASYYNYVGYGVYGGVKP